MTREASFVQCAHREFSLIGVCQEDHGSCGVSVKGNGHNAESIDFGREEFCQEDIELIGGEAVYGFFVVVHPFDREAL